MQAGHVLHDQRVAAVRVAIPLRGDPPHLHLADPMLRHSSDGETPPGSSPSGRPSTAHPGACGRASPRTSRDRPCRAVRLASGSRHRPGPVVDLLVMDAADLTTRTPPQSARRRGFTPHAARLGAAGGHDLVLDRVPLLLARGELPLSPALAAGSAARWRRRTTRGCPPLSSFTRRSGMRKMPANSGCSGLMLRPTAESSTPKRKPRKAWVV